MSRIIFDEPPWWQQPRWQLVAAAVLAVAALAIWWTALTPVDHDPIVVRAPAAPNVMARSAPPAPPVSPPSPRPAAASPPPPGAREPDDESAPPAAPPRATWVAPAARATPLNLPPGLLQGPAEQPSDENLED